MKFDELKSIAPEIAAHIEAIYTDGAVLLDVPGPHALAHQVAEHRPGLGAAFYRLVTDAAREYLLGAPLVTQPESPRVSPALAGLINGLDSSWF